KLWLNAAVPLASAAIGAGTRSPWTRTVASDAPPARRATPAAAAAARSAAAAVAMPSGSLTPSLACSRASPGMSSKRRPWPNRARRWEAVAASAAGRDPARLVTERLRRRRRRSRLDPSGNLRRLRRGDDAVRVLLEQEPLGDEAVRRRGDRVHVHVVR